MQFSKSSMVCMNFLKKQVNRSLWLSGVNSKWISSGFSKKLCRSDFAESVSEHSDLKCSYLSALMYHCTVIFIHLCYWFICGIAFAMMQSREEACSTERVSTSDLAHKSSPLIKLASSIIFFSLAISCRVKAKKGVNLLQTNSKSPQWKVEWEVQSGAKHSITTIDVNKNKAVKQG